MNKLYTSKRSLAATGAAALLAAMKTSMPVEGALQSNLAGKAVSMESLNDAEAGVVGDALSSLAGGLKEAYMTAFGSDAKLSVAQEEAGLGGVLIGANPTSFLSGNRYSDADLQRFEGNFGTQITHVISSAGIEGALDRRVAFEGYDNNTNREVGRYSATYNVQAARQISAGELMYPTVVVAPNQAGYNVNVRLIYAFDAVARNVDGSLNQFNRRNIIKALIDKSVLSTEQTRLIPVYRAGVNEAMFAAGIAAVDVVTADKETIKTAPLAVNKKFSILGLSQTNATVAAGTFDQTDAVDSARLTKVYLKIVDGSTTEYIPFDVASLPTADFNAFVQGNSQGLQLNFRTKSLLVSASTKTNAGTASTLLASMNTTTARLELTMSGSIIRDTGDTEMLASGVTLAAYNADDGTVLSTGTGAGATLKTLLESATVVGYELLAYRSNSNKRSGGKLLDPQEINFLYNVPQLSPLRMARSMMADDSQDAQMLADLVAATRMQTAGAMVTELLRARDVLKGAVAGDTKANNPQVFGAASLLVDPAYSEDTLDVAVSIDSRTTNERIADIQALLVNKIRSLATKVYIDSGYGPALETFYPGQNKKPLIVGVCDPQIYQYLFLVGDTRLAGEMFDIKIEQCFDERMTGKLIFSFGVAEAEGSGTPTVLHFGNFAYRSELTAILPATRNGAQSLELTVAPSYRHVTNLPIMAYLTVTNLSQVAAGKVTVNMHQV